MKYVILPPQPLPKQETVHHRPKTLGEMKLAFLNANNPKQWAHDAVPDVPASRVFKSHRKFMAALHEQQGLLKTRERERFMATHHTVPSFLDLLISSRRESIELAFAECRLYANEYFTRRSQLYAKFMEDELKKFVFSEDIMGFFGTERKHVYATRTDFSYRDLVEKP